MEAPKRAKRAVRVKSKTRGAAEMSFYGGRVSLAAQRSQLARAELTKDPNVCALKSPMLISSPFATYSAMTPPKGQRAASGEL